MAKKYSITDKKEKLAEYGSQIIKIDLEEQKKKLIRTYAGKHKEKRNIVRRRKRQLKGIDISLPYEPSVKKLCKWS